MKEFFETKIKFMKTMEDGLQKKVTESYLVGAMTFTEAENRIIEEMTPFIVGEFEVNAVKKFKVNELFLTDADNYYCAKVASITLDEKSGVEKTSVSNMVIRADKFKDAYDALVDGMKGTMSDWEVVSISKMSILDIFGDD